MSLFYPKIPVLLTSGSIEAFNLSIFDPTINAWTAYRNYLPTYVGDVSDTVEVSSSVNVAEVNFSSFGVASNAYISKIRVFGSAADIAAFGGLNSSPVDNPIPEQATMLLLGPALFGLLGYWRERG